MTAAQLRRLRLRLRPTAAEQEARTRAVAHAGLTQGEMATRLGYAVSHYQKFELGTARIHPRLVKLLEAMP